MACFLPLPWTQYFSQWAGSTAWWVSEHVNLNPLVQPLLPLACLLPVRFPGQKRKHCLGLGYTQGPVSALLQVETSPWPASQPEVSLPAVCTELFPIREIASGPLSPFTSGRAGLSRCSQIVLLTSPAGVYSQFLIRDLKHPLIFCQFQHNAPSPLQSLPVVVCSEWGIRQLSQKHKHILSRGTVCQEDSPGQTV